MKPTRFILGIITILIGLVLLVSNLGYLNVDWQTILKIWPAILIFWGISLFFSRSALSRLFSAAALVILGLVLVAGAKTSWTVTDQIIFDSRSESQTFESSLDNIDKADLTLNSGAGTFILKETTDKLISANVISSIGRYDLKETRDGATANLTLEPKGKNISTAFGRNKNTVDIKLNPNPLWTLNFRLGAASADLDLSQYSLEKAIIEAGASSIDLKIGKKNTKTDVVVKAGASSLNISVPETSGTEVRASTGLSSRSFDGFTKTGDNTYRTDNFETAINKVYVDLSTGVSSINISRY